MILSGNVQRFIFGLTHERLPCLFFPSFFNLRPVSSDQTDFIREYNKIDLRN